MFDGITNLSAEQDAKFDELAAPADGSPTPLPAGVQMYLMWLDLTTSFWLMPPPWYGKK